MKLTNVISMLMLTGATAVAFAASDIAQSQSKKPPANRLSAELSKDMDNNQRNVSGKAQAVEMRERLLQATSNRLADQANTMPPQQPTEQNAPNGKAEPDESILQLVKVYQSMKPKAAARVFETLDIEIQVAVASKMRSQSMAKLMDAMTPNAASRLTTALARPQSIADLKRAAAKPPTGAPVGNGNRTPSGSPLATR